jgi:hypothetical protein
MVIKKILKYLEIMNRPSVDFEHLGLNLASEDIEKIAKIFVRTEHQ